MVLEAIAGGEVWVGLCGWVGLVIFVNRGFCGVMLALGGGDLDCEGGMILVTRDAESWSIDTQRQVDGAREH